VLSWKVDFFCCWCSWMEQLTATCPDIRDTDNVQESPQDSSVCWNYLTLTEPGTVTVAVHLTLSAPVLTFAALLCPIIIFLK